jgi:hypothetical protein
MILVFRSSARYTMVSRSQAPAGAPDLHHLVVSTHGTKHAGMRTTFGRGGAVDRDMCLMAEERGTGKRPRMSTAVLCGACFADNGATSFQPSHYSRRAPFIPDVVGCNCHNTHHRASPIHNFPQLISESVETNKLNQLSQGRRRARLTERRSWPLSNRRSRGHGTWSYPMF